MSIPVWIGDHAALSFGWYHRALGDQRGVGVVLCNPLGYEAMCVHRTYRLLAERLARDGFPVVRFDYHGAGDSAGTESDPQRLTAWKSSVKTAVEGVQRFSGVQLTVLFGLRFGATLALATAAELDNIAGVVAWAPFMTGKTYTRELRAFNMLKSEADASSTHLEAAGFILPNEAVEALNQLDLTKVVKPVAPHILLLQRDATSGEGRLAKHFGIESELVPGYEAMMRDPHEAIVPTEVIERVAGWLGETFPERRGPGVSAPLGLHEHPVDGAREQPLFFGPDSRLFGILTTSEQWVRTWPLVLLLNTGSNHHVGAHRMSVTLARRLASFGFASFRFDIAGLGDSALIGDARGKRHYAPDAVGDVQAAIALLQTAADAEKFIVVGLCSGAYLGFNATSQTPSIVGQVLINLQPMIIASEGLTSARALYKSNQHYRARLFDPDTYKRLLRGDINATGIASTVANRLVRQLKNRMRDILRGPPNGMPSNPVAAGFFAIAERGADSLVVFSSDDTGIDQLSELMEDRLDRLMQHPRFHYRIIDGADHTFAKAEPRARLLDLIVGHINERFS